MEFNISITGSAIQCAGLFLITILCGFLTRFIRRTPLQYWFFGWSCLVLALAAISIAFRIPSNKTWFFFIYYLFEYAFGFLVFAGCRNFVSKQKLSIHDGKTFLVYTAVAVLISTLPVHYNVKFMPHYLVVAFLFFKSYRILKPMKTQKRPGPGLLVTSMGLLLLTISFLHYIPIFGYVLFLGKLPIVYLDYSPIYDLLLELLLGFGMIMVIMEDMQNEVETINRELINTRDQLEILARHDPLTKALNRHAFYSLMNPKSSASLAAAAGCVAVIDIDNLKPINDAYGHSAGDVAIREVASCLRSVIRADDMLFRWGGDEFLILLFNIPEPEVSRRIAALNLNLTAKHLPDIPQALPLIFSFGIAPFNGLEELEKAIEIADTLMYASKQRRKSSTEIEIESIAS
jgi:diguanylate cyclase (GGDEF)-like protein